MRVSMLSPMAWRTPPRRYGPWQSVVALLTEGLPGKTAEVTLFATADSRTAGALRERFDLSQHHFDFLPLICSRLASTPAATTIQSFSFPRSLSIPEQDSTQAHAIAIREADRPPF